MDARLPLGLAMLLLLQLQVQCSACWIRIFVVLLGSLNGPHPLCWGLSARLAPLLLLGVVRPGRQKQGIGTSGVSV